jgi:hypothetical protein
MAQQFKNNARALLVAGISSTDTSLVVESAKADLFPVANTGTGSIPSASSWFKATLQDSTGAVEIVYVRTRTAGSGIFSNVIRAQESTTALNFLAGTVVGLRVTAGDVQTALDLPSQASTFTGNNTFSGDNTLSGDNTFSGENSFAGASSFAGSVTGQGLINLLYPVGSVYINATNNSNPGTLFGVGTWTAFGAGRVPVGFNASNTLFDTAEETGGSPDAIVVSHTHTATSTVSDPGHRHNTTLDGNTATNSSFQAQAGRTTYSTADGGYEGYYSRGVADSTQANASTSSTSTTGVTVSTTNASTGSAGTNANYQPFITVYMWKRTA